MVWNHIWCIFNRHRAGFISSSSLFCATYFLTVFWVIFGRHKIIERRVKGKCGAGGNFSLRTQSSTTTIDSASSLDHVNIYCANKMFRHGSDTVEMDCAARMFNKRIVGSSSRWIMFKYLNNALIDAWNFRLILKICFAKIRFGHNRTIFWFTRNSHELVSKLKNFIAGEHFLRHKPVLLMLFSYFFCPREKLETPLFPRTRNSSSKCVALHSFGNKIFRLHINPTCEWENCFPRLMTHRRRLVRSLMH